MPVMQPSSSSSSSPLQVVNILLFCGLLALMVVNRLSIRSLKTDMNRYIDKDLKNLRKILEVTMHNDNKLEQKTNFILNVLEEEDRIEYNPGRFDLKSKDELDVSDPSGNWLDNVITNDKFRKLLLSDSR